VTPLYTVVLLFDPPGERVLLLERAPWKAFAPGRLTGIGGRAEPGEAPEAAAWRELREETGLGPADLTGWRAWARVACPDEGIELLYCVARVRAPTTPACREGVLRWVPVGELPRPDVIENTAAVLEWVLARPTPPKRPRRGVYRDGRLTWRTPGGQGRRRRTG
jgi:8-oxo-dGTP diphosphatase